MKNIFTTVLLLLTVLLADAQTIYSKSFGNAKHKPIIFLHGGPGYNCANFEATAAQELADNGFYVIIYDRRGEGRSKDPNAKFTFEETFKDIADLYKQYNITTATLMGHSFGGVVATLFAESHPKKVKSLILVGAPVSLQATFKSIIAKTKGIYQEKKDSINLGYLSMLEKMDPASIMYSSYCFRHAMQNGFYTPKNMTEDAKKIYASFKADTALAKQAGNMSFEAPQGFWTNEHYTTIDLTNNLRSLQKQNIPIYGLYGKDDGLYSAQQIEDLQNLIGKDQVEYLDNCSHSVFMDQQRIFINSVKRWEE